MGYQNNLNMKKTTLLIIAAFAFCIMSCKKDRTCECVTTHTSSNGNVTTTPNDNITYREIKKGQAKDLCQKSTRVYVGSSGSTTTDVYDCKLK